MIDDLWAAGFRPQVTARAYGREIALRALISVCALIARLQGRKLRVTRIEQA